MRKLTNISNLKNVGNFMRAGKTVVSDLLEKYHNGEMADPADYDPRNPDDVTWSNTQRF